jgi:hypothetical protein
LRGMDSGLSEWEGAGEGSASSTYPRT